MYIPKITRPKLTVPLPFHHFHSPSPPFKKKTTSEKTKATLPNYEGLRRKTEESDETTSKTDRLKTSGVSFFFDKQKAPKMHSGCVTYRLLVVGCVSQDVYPKNQWEFRWLFENKRTMGANSHCHSGFHESQSRSPNKNVMIIFLLLDTVRGVGIHQGTYLGKML